jgi:hypothetical protein
MQKENNFGTFAQTIKINEHYYYIVTKSGANTQQVTSLS